MTFYIIRRWWGHFVVPSRLMGSFELADRRIVNTNPNRNNDKR